MASSHQQNIGGYIQEEYDPWAVQHDDNTQDKKGYWATVGGDPEKSLYPSKPRLEDHSWNWRELAAQQQHERPDPCTEDRKIGTRPTQR